jgi:hypothetical protein
LPLAARDFLATHTPRIEVSPCAGGMSSQVHPSAPKRLESDGDAVGLGAHLLLGALIRESLRDEREARNGSGYRRG